MEKIKLIDDWLDTAQLICTKADGRTKYDFSNFTFSSKIALKTFRRELALQKAWSKYDQVNLEISINKLNNSCNPKNLEKIKEKDDTLKSAKKLLSIREKPIRAFEKGVFPYIDGFQVGKESHKESDEESGEESDESEEIDIPDLESEELVAKKKKQKGQVLKILAPNQMLSRLPITLAQLKARIYSEKLKNEIRQLFYSLYRSKKLKKQLIKL